MLYFRRNVRPVAAFENERSLRDRTWQMEKIRSGAHFLFAADARPNWSLLGLPFARDAEFPLFREKVPIITAENAWQEITISEKPGPLEFIAVR